MKQTDAERSLPQAYLDSLSDADLANACRKMQHLANLSQRETAQYQRAVAKLDSQIQRRAASARKVA